MQNDGERVVICFPCQSSVLCRIGYVGCIVFGRGIPELGPVPVRSEGIEGGDVFASARRLVGQLAETDYGMFTPHVELGGFGAGCDGAGQPWHYG